MPIAAHRRWRSSERIALSMLEQLGYRVIDTRVKVRVDGIEIAEIDAIVEDEQGERYAVEIKAGRIDVTGLRQAYVNAELLGLKPMIVAKGFADEAAEALAEKLGVKTILLSDYYLVEAEELEILIREAIGQIISDTLTLVAAGPMVSPEEQRVLEAIASSPNIAEAADKLGVSVKELTRIINRMRSRGILPHNAKQYYLVRYYASIILFKQKLGVLEELLRTAINKESTETVNK